MSLKRMHTVNNVLFICAALAKQHKVLSYDSDKQDGGDRQLRWSRRARQPRAVTAEAPVERQ